MVDGGGWQSVAAAAAAGGGGEDISGSGSTGDREVAAGGRRA